MWNGAAIQECGETVFVQESVYVAHHFCCVASSTVSTSKSRLCEAVRACSPGYSPCTREERLIGLAIIDFFSPDQRMRRCESPINLDMDPKNDVGFLGAVSGLDSPEQIVTTLLL